MNYLTTREISELWGISSRRVALLCEENRIQNSFKKGKTWLIPEDAPKPTDQRRKKAESADNLYAKTEKKFNVIYPENPNATYTSILNYSDDLSRPYQRWFRYKEGFSVELIEQLIKKYSSRKSGIIMDPFAGSGTTLLKANELGYDAVGFEVNPFSAFLSQCKLCNYTSEQIEYFKQAYENTINACENDTFDYELPKLSISNKVFSDNIEAYFMSVKSYIASNYNDDKDVYNLLLLGWLACLEVVSNYRKAGNGLKIKKYVKPRNMTRYDIRVMLLEEYQNIYIDLLRRKNTSTSNVINDSCLNMSRYVEDGSVEGIIFSPPYANCFDYTEIYKLELWFGDFVTDYSQLKELRKKSIHSNLNGDLSVDVSCKSNMLEELLDELQGKDLWDKKIPKMLRLYYDDMFKVIDECYRVLDKKGFCCIVVGNSSYGGIIFPADLIISEYAERVGFCVDKIEVDRYIITSSQQYEITKENGKYLRESVICLIKK